MTAGAARYPGTELQLFAGARRWKRYLRAQLGPYVRGDVLEVGAGIGTTTRALWSSAVRSWTALEPDPELSRAARDGAAPVGGAPLRHVVGTVADLERAPVFDAILYVDVLEHVGDDRGELERAAGLLRPGGRLVVVAPAHQLLYTPFDEAIGHFRRYSAGQLRALTPGALRIERTFYLDSVGLLASGGNRLLLRSAAPSPFQVRVVWDGLLVPLSRVVDPLLGRRIGKTVVAIWAKGT